jgi:hypothetical protein
MVARLYHFGIRSFFGVGFLSIRHFRIISEMESCAISRRVPPGLKPHSQWRA